MAGRSGERKDGARQSAGRAAAIVVDHARILDGAGEWIFFWANFWSGVVEGQTQWPVRVAHNNGRRTDALRRAFLYVKSSLIASKYLIWLRVPKIRMSR